MKLINKIKSFIIFCLIAIAVISCEYKEISDAEYPAQTVYLPSATSGVFLINDTNQWTFGKEPGTMIPSTSRYELDIPNNKMIIPIGIYRSGVNNNGNITVDLTVDNDNVMEILEENTVIDIEGLDIQIMSSSAYTLGSTVTINSGSELTSTNLEIDLDYLATQPDKYLALGISVSSTQVATSIEVGTAVILIGTDFIMPSPKYRYVIDRIDDKQVTFYSDASSYAKSFIWKFDNTSVATTDKSTIHKFDDYGVHNIEFSVIGITGKAVTKTFSLYLWQNVTASYIKNPGDPFSRADATRTQNIGNLADWITTDNLKTTLSGGVYYGGYVRSQRYGTTTLQHFMDFYSPDAIENGKIYQSIILPAGNYRATFMPYGFLGSNDCYFVVAAGNTMPDADNIDSNGNVLAKLFFNEELADEQELFFTISSEQEITIGFIVNTQTPPNGVTNEVMIQSVGLYK